MSGIKDRMKRFDIREEPSDARERHVTDLQIDREYKLQDYDFQRLRKAGEGDYGAVRGKYGPLAATDPDRAAKSRKDSRFAINPLLKAPLAIEEEERRVIEEKVREEIARVSEAARLEAERKGYEDGLKRGHKEAYDRWAREGAVRLQKFDQFLQSCEQAKTDIFQENERFLMEVVFRVARMVLLRELKTDKEHLLRVTREILERIGIRDNVRIRINFQDAQTAELLREGLQASLGRMQNLNIETTDEVRLGGCVVETEWNAIDASIETQLANIYQALIGGADPAGGGTGAGASGADPASGAGFGRTGSGA